MAAKRRLEDPSFTFGAWLLTCDPTEWDITSFSQDRAELRSWSVKHNYRLDHLELGQPVVIWVTGSDPHHTSPGVWGVGIVDGQPYEDTSTTGDDSYWTDDEKRKRRTLFLPVHLRFLPTPIDAALLRELPALSDAEIVKVPNQSNPQILSEDEWEAVAAHLPEEFRHPELWPPTEDPFVEEIASRSGVDAGLVEEVLLEQDLWTREFVRDGVAIFHPTGCEAEVGHPALEIVGDWPTEAADGDPEAYLNSIDGLKHLNHQWQWRYLPDALVRNAGELGFDEAAARAVLEAFWQVAIEEQDARPFGPLELGISSVELTEMLAADDFWNDEFGDGSIVSDDLPSEASLIYRLSGSDDVLAVVVEAGQANAETLERVERVLAGLAQGGRRNAACLVVADGRDAIYRAATLDRDDLYYRSAVIVFQAADDADDTLG